MKSDDVIKFIEEMYKDNVEVMKRKNADYSGKEDNFFNNFETVEKLGLTDTARGILVRCTDKYTRIINLLDNEAQVSDEKVSDTIKDFINYLAILAAYLDKDKKMIGARLPDDLCESTAGKTSANYKP